MSTNIDMLTNDELYAIVHNALHDPQEPETATETETCPPNRGGHEDDAYHPEDELSW